MGIIVKNGMDRPIYFSSDPLQTNGSGYLKPGDVSEELPNEGASISYYEEINGKYDPSFGPVGTFTPEYYLKYGSEFTITGGVTVSKL